MQASNLAQAGDAFFALTHSMNMHGRAAAMVTPIGDKKTLLPAASAVSSSGCAGRGRLKSGSSRKKKWKHARLQGAQRREGVCVGLACRGPECDFLCGLLEGGPRCSHSSLREAISHLALTVVCCCCCLVGGCTSRSFDVAFGQGRHAPMARPRRG